MRPEGPTFWLLKASLGWRTAHVDGVAVGEGSDIRLAADPVGPLSLNSSDGSLGGLVLPQGMALDDSDRLYLLNHSNARVRRFDALAKKFHDLPGVGGEGSDARQFRLPANIAVAGNDLYVADRGNRRIQVFALDTLALRHVWGPWDAEGCGIEPEDPAAWEPLDVAGVPGLAVILDTRHGTLYAHRPGSDALTKIIERPEAADRWTRVILDTQQRIYLLDPLVTRLEIFDLQGRPLGEVDDAGDVLSHFTPPAIRLDHMLRFCMPEPLTRLCARDADVVRPPPGQALIDCAPQASSLMFDRCGERLSLAREPEPAGPRLYRKSGVWISEALDSQVYACQWHRIETHLTDLPAGTHVVISTYTDGEARTTEDILALPDHLWETRYTVSGAMQDTKAPTGVDARDVDVLVQSPQGQYLWLRLELMGEGYATPVIGAARIHYPRDSYLQYLPAVYAMDEESRAFLERFLALFQTEWDAVEAKIESIAAYFDPDAVPEGAFLDYLSQWLALPLEGEWSETQKRRLLSAAPALYERRGTPASLRAYLRIYLANLTALEPDEQGDFPLLIEGFRRRDHLMLTDAATREIGGDDPGHALLGRGHPLWSASVVARLQLDVYAREGQARLVSTGDPARDVFHEYAHRFRVYLPSAWIVDRNAEDMVLRALDTEKPAHTEYDLCLVEPRLRVGIQSSVGVDTIIGDYPVAVLACAEDSDAPRHRAPRQRLGYDTVLACGTPERGGVLLRAGMQVGMNTVLS